MSDNKKIRTIARQKKWDSVFDENMTMELVETLLQQEPLRSLAKDKIERTKNQDPSNALNGLKDILLHEARIDKYKENELICRQGDYGGSAYLVLSGQVISLQNIDSRILGRSKPKSRSFGKLLLQGWRNPTLPETRDVSRYTSSANEVLKARPILKNIKRAKSVDDSPTTDNIIGSNVMLGVISALRRSPRTSTLIAHTDCEILEIKWQGLRDLMGYSKWFRNYLDELYRTRSLKQHFLTLPLLKTIPNEHLVKIIESAVFENFGKSDWNTSFKKLDHAEGDEVDRLKDEPLILEQGDYASGLIMLRSGFARVLRKYHKKQQTIDYMRGGDIIGASLLAYNINNSNKLTYPYSVRAIGYVDIIRISLPVFEKHILPFIQLEKIEASEKCSISWLAKQKSVMSDAALNRSSALLEFFVERRYINGTKTMIINTDRCTNCDDCVRACAMAHENNPRFIRHGFRTDKYMIANACMHCSDPVCMLGCPTGAIHRIASGSVVINDDTCIGCATCANSCPYNNIRMVTIQDRDGVQVLDEKNNPIVKATKCDLCVGQRVSPACEQACPHGALRRIDIHDIENLTDWLEE